MHYKYVKYIGLIAIQTTRDGDDDGIPVQMSNKLGMMEFNFNFILFD